MILDDLTKHAESTSDNHNSPQGKLSGWFMTGYRGREMRIGIITGLFDRKSEYRIRLVAWLFGERVGLYDE
jgi:hypothetical protein